MSSFYVTTPIYYVNGSPHLGHAYTTIIADIFARHFRQRGDDVFFLTGTDEHGLKVQRAAEEAGVDVQDFVDQNSQAFRELFNQLELTHDRFIRTTEEDHKRTVKEIVDRMWESGDIYLDKYEGWYSASDEAYYKEDEIEDGQVIATGSEVEWVEEDSYFFRLSNYEDELLEWYRGQSSRVQPDSRLKEVESFVDEGLEDLSITRTTFDWGLPFERDPDHVLYVWVDALTNYISAIDAFGDSGQFENFWPADMHMIGKDILRFHAVYWPAFLMSAGLEPPKQVFAHGWWMVEGEKMSKSKGNFIDAFELAENYDLDLLRYYLSREVPFGNDGNFAKDRIVERNNAELADNLGNLVNRVLGMVDGFTDGEVPTEGRDTGVKKDQQIRQLARRTKEKVLEQMNDREPHRAIESIMEFSGTLNQYIQETKPWEQNKHDKTERVHQILYTALEGIRWTAALAYPFIPDASAKILESLGETDEGRYSFERLSKWQQLEPGYELGDPGVLFEKLEKDELPTLIGGEDDEQSDDSESEESSNIEYVSFGDFQDMDIRVGLIEDAQPVEDADKLFKLSVDLGEQNPRTVVAGLAEDFTPDELVGMRVNFLANLEPAEIFGIESQAMLLAAENSDGELVLAQYGDDVEPGTEVH